MAAAQSIAAVSAVLAGLLQDRYPRKDFGPALPIKLYQPRNFDDAMKEGIAVCLWRIVPNVNRRNPGPRTDAAGLRFRPSLPFDLYYLIVPFAEDAERQQRLLGWVLQAMHDLGPLGAPQLNHYLAESDIFGPEETIDAVADPLGVGDYLTLWDRVKRLPPAASYVVRMVLIDSQIGLDEAALVQERRFDMGVITQ
jgi:hypothetical protein